MPAEHNVFLSYGHKICDQAIKDFSDKIKEKLKDTDFNFFLDSDVLREGDWENIIDAHIKACKWMLFFVSARSVSRDGYCLNELCRACECGLKVIPILVDGAEVPLSINRFQRYDLRDLSGQVTQQKIDEVVCGITDVLLGKKELGFADEDMNFSSCLRPIDFKYDISVFYEGFVGREDAFTQVGAWLNDPTDDNIFLITSYPGFGKSAFSANCCWKFSTEISAIHFCKFDNSDKADPKRIITSLAYSLAQKLPEYKNRISRLQELSAMLSAESSMNAVRIFELLFVEPLNEIKVESPVLIIIDALDEAIWQGRLNNEFCSILRSRKKDLPTWLKILVTSREDNLIINELQYVSRTYTVTPEINKNDIKLFFANQLKKIMGVDIPQVTIDELYEKSEGSFIYATEIIKYIKKYNTSLDDLDVLPSGLYSLYSQSFDRLFAPNQRVDFNRAVKVLEVVCVTPEELTVSFLSGYLGWEEREVYEVLDVISPLIPLKNNRLAVVHKTLKDWLVSHDLAGRYFVSEADAYKVMYRYMDEKYKQRTRYSDYLLKHFGMVLMKNVEFASEDLKDDYVEKLVALLSDENFQKSRIKCLTLDTMLGVYLKELEFVFAFDENMVCKVFASDCFARLFSAHRRIFYNSGLFFNLKSIGFSNFLKNYDTKWDVEGEVGQVFYFYITEQFELAIESVDNVVNEFCAQLKSDLLAELYNIKGLSQRKTVEFDKALDSFDTAIKYGQKVDYYFELCMSHLLKSKINVRMGEYNLCIKNTNSAIEYLEEAIDFEEDKDKKLSHRLFMAEVYRVACDNYIWMGELGKAENYVCKSDAVYTKTSAIDRYYIRVQYTRTLLEIAQLKRGLLDKINRIESQITSSSYDTGTINAIKALYLFVSGEDLELASACASKAIRTFKRIKCPLEQEKAVCLFNLMCEDELDKKDVNVDNPFIVKWIEKVQSVIVAIKKGYENA